MNGAIPPVSPTAAGMPTTTTTTTTTTVAEPNGGLQAGAAPVAAPQEGAGVGVGGDVVMTDVQDRAAAADLKGKGGDLTSEEAAVADSGQA